MVIDPITSKHIGYDWVAVGIKSSNMAAKLAWVGFSSLVSCSDSTNSSNALEPLVGTSWRMNMVFSLVVAIVPSLSLWSKVSIFLASSDGLRSSGFIILQSSTVHFCRAAFSYLFIRSRLRCRNTIEYVQDLHKPRPQSEPHLLSKMAFSCLVCVLLALMAVGLPCSAINNRPIIGIVSEKVSNNNKTYIAASYVKYLESAGARVVPIPSDTSTEEVKLLFYHINGVLFPGGGVSLNESMYSEVGQLIFSMAKEAYDKGDYFPLWGTCLGFQLLCVMQAGSTDILSHFDSENYTIPLNFTERGGQSRLFSSYSEDELNWISSEPITMNNHQYGVTPKLFAATPALSEFFAVLSTNVDRKGEEFVSSIEGKTYPFYGVQWHPEKNAFEWEPTQATSHTSHAVEITQATANFFVNEARKSNHHFYDQDSEAKALIYNYCPVFTDSFFEQTYYF